VSLIESILAFFQMQVERMSRDAIELLQTTLGARPETFNAVDVAVVISKLILRVKHTEMLRVTNINQTIVAAPAIGVNYRVERDMTTNHLLQRAFLTIRHDLSIDRAITLEDAEDDSFTTRATPALAPHTTRTDSRDSSTRDDARKGRGSFAFLGDALTNFDKEHGHATACQTDHLGCLAGGQIMREEAHDLTHFTFANFGTPIISV